MQRPASTAPHSITALAVAHALQICAENDKLTHLVDPELAVLNEHVFKKLMKKHPVNMGSLTYRGLSIFPASGQKSFMDTFGVIGLPEHVAMRKLMMEQQVRKAIEEGAKQVLIVGAGYDLLAARLHAEFKDVTFIEFDRGETRKTKLEIINELVALGLIVKKANLIFLDCDLSKKGWQLALSEIGFDKTKKSVAILEGLTMYLTLEQNTDLLKVLRDEVLSEASKIILSFHETNKYILANSRAASMISEAGESLLAELQPNAVLTYAHQMRFSVLGKALASYFQQVAGNGAAIVNADPKHLIVENYYLLSTTPPDMNATNDISEVLDIKITVPPKNEPKERCSIS